MKKKSGGGQASAKKKCLEVFEKNQRICRERGVKGKKNTSMRDHPIVQVLQPLKKLIHDILSLGLTYLIACPRSVVNICEKISASTQLEKYVTSSNYYQT